MTLVLKTPGVYIQELDAFGNSVVPVPTAIPAFIGYTQTASYGGQSLLNRAVKVESLLEYQTFFGTGPTVQFSLDATGGSGSGSASAGAAVQPDVTMNNESYVLNPVEDSFFMMYNAIRLFYQNGGGTCYIIAIGTFGGGSVAALGTTPMQNALTLLNQEPEPTMVLIPDSVLLGANDCYSIQGEMLNHCADTQNMNRVAILDIYNGSMGLDNPNYNPIEDFRNQVNSIYSTGLSYGAAYYPWLNTTIVQSSEVSYQNLDDASITILQAALNAETASMTTLNATQVAQRNAMVAQMVESSGSGSASGSGAATTRMSPTALNMLLAGMSPTYSTLMSIIQQKLNLLPPGPAMAGIYTATDNSRGVWKAPANVGLAAVVSPSVTINDTAQQDLNVPLAGKAVCAIRSFAGEGVLVWGARTLDGNSDDWRYINVRRTMIFLEQSVKAAARAYVFEPNVASTWTVVKSTISNFLNGIWKQGGLAGAKPEDAFSVQVGLGSTMTSQDILNGVMNITVLVAISHPAEFLVITFQQQMQKS